jgi:hypothetical protein
MAEFQVQSWMGGILFVSAKIILHTFCLGLSYKLFLCENCGVLTSYDTGTDRGSSCILHHLTLNAYDKKRSVLPDKWYTSNLYWSMKVH